MDADIDIAQFRAHTMSEKVTKTPFKGGWIKRDSATGRFVEVNTSKGSAKASARSSSAAKEASSRRSSALKRLADR